MLTYGGVPLLLPDADADLQKWMRQNQDIADLVEFGDPSLGQISPRRGLLNWYGYRKGIGQTVANYAAAPAPRLNTLYWPTGATRWARGYFLATETQKNKITRLAHRANGNSPLSLQWGDPDHRQPALSASMYLLPPRPVARCAEQYHHPDETLYLLPLVDERYHWQTAPVSDLSITSSTTWADLFSTLGTALGVAVSVPSGVDAGYLSPDPYEFTRRYENAAQMLDAAALSVGKRIVRKIDGTVRAESSTEAEITIANNVTFFYQLLAGGFYHLEHGYRPEKVLTTFRKWRYYALLQKGQAYKIEKDPAITTATIPGSRKVIHSTMHADCSVDTDSPTNTADLDALAQLISDDYYNWLRTRYDITYAGTYPWELNGYDDSVLWEFGRQIEGGPASGIRLAQTRVQSQPVDFGFEHQLSQKNTLTLYEPLMLGKPDADIAKGDTGTVSVWEGRAGSRSDQGRDVEATATGAALTAGKWVFLTWIEDDWEVSPYECGGE